jgi:PTS system N-acetylgalactosamine-specific IIA component
MKYVVLVSHGEFANGLKNALFMLSGKRDDVISTGLLDGLSAEEFAKVFEDAIKPIKDNDEIILLGDIIGGSPLTTALNVVVEKGIKVTVIGGMNLPLALTTVLMKDNLDGDVLVSTVLSEASSALKEFQLVDDDDEEDL